MTALTVYDKTGSEVGTLDVNVEQLAEKINKQLLHDAVVMYQANLRQGSAKTKSRAEIIGSRKKMYRQKGTGNARAGHRMSGVRRGGGHIFAKRPRDFSYRLPKKMLKAATRMAFASKIIDDEITVIDDFKIDAPKTSEMARVLKALKLDKTTLLIGIEDLNTALYKSVKNIQGVSILPCVDFNALSLLKPKRLLITKAALEKFCEKFAKA